MEISEIHSHNFLTKSHEKKTFFTTYIIYKIVYFTKYLFSENTFLVFPLCAEVKSTQCKNFKIFLSFRFCVKSILGDFRSSKNAVFAILWSLYFVILVNFSLQNSEDVSKCVKMEDFALLESPKLISRKI